MHAHLTYIPRCRARENVRVRTFRGCVINAITTIIARFERDANAQTARRCRFVRPLQEACWPNLRSDCIAILYFIVRLYNEQTGPPSPYFNVFQSHISPVLSDSLKNNYRWLRLFSKIRQQNILRLLDYYRKQYYIKCQSKSTKLTKLDVCRSNVDIFNS